MHKLLLLFLLYVFVQNSNCKINSVASAIAEIVCKFYLNRSESFDIIIYGTEMESLKEIVDDVLKVNEAAVKVI